MADVVDQTVSNPQPLVDAALGVTPEVKTPLSPLEPLSPPIAPITTTTTTTTTPVFTPNLPTTSPIPELKVGDETPLAFMTPIAPPAQSGVIPNNPIISQNQDYHEEQKPKKGKGKAFALVIALFLLLAGLGGGFYFYTNYLPAEPSTISNIQTKYPTRSECNGACDNGRLLKWDIRNERCEDSGKACTGGGGGAGQTTIVSCDTPGHVQCDGCGGFCIIPIDKTCNDMQLIKCGQNPVYGAACMSTAPTTPEAKKQFFYPCDCGGKKYWFDSQGTCGNVDDGFSLCAVTKYATCVNDAGGSGGGGAGGSNCDYKCTNNGCQCNSGDCQVSHWKCDRITNLGGGCQDGTPKIGTSASFSASCGSEQIDVVCNGKNIDFRSRTNTTACGSTPKPSPSGTLEYSMSCTGLTKNVVAPIVGSKITFTCAGKTVPAAGATLLKYNFRYSLDSGTWKNLTNKTNSTAELTIAACGSYSVQCRACVTYGGKTQCDPIWQGATQ